MTTIQGSGFHQIFILLILFGRDKQAFRIGVKDSLFFAFANPYLPASKQCDFHAEFAEFAI